MASNQDFLGKTKNINGESEDQLKARRTVLLRNALIILIAALSLVTLYYLSQYSYLLFHSVVEIFSIVIAGAIFAIAWNTRRLVDNNYFMFIGIAFFFVAALDILHMLAYKGMGLFPMFPGANLATQLWIAMRYVLAFSFLIPLVFSNRKLKPSITVAGYSIATTLILTSIFVWQNFPMAYNNGLTAFKIASEYAISLISLAAILLYVKKRKEFSEGIFKLLLVAMALVIASEMAFTLYVDVYGIANMVGHLLNVVSFYLIYRALIQTGLTKPYDLLFRNLKQSENTLANRAQELTQVNDRIETANLKLAESLNNQKELQAKLEEKAVEVEEYASQMEAVS